MTPQQEPQKTVKLSKKMAKIGSKGGRATFRKRGKKFFAKISGMRKHFRGGRKPKKSITPETLDS